MGLLIAGIIVLIVVAGVAVYAWKKRDKALLDQEMR